MRLRLQWLIGLASLGCGTRADFASDEQTTAGGVDASVDLGSTEVTGGTAHNSDAGVSTTPNECVAGRDGGGPFGQCRAKKDTPEASSIDAGTTKQGHSAQLQDAGAWEAKPEPIENRFDSGTSGAHTSTQGQPEADPAGTSTIDEMGDSSTKGTPEHSSSSDAWSEPASEDDAGARGRDGGNVGQAESPPPCILDESTLPCVLK
jgi:hypothetical protein